MILSLTICSRFSRFHSIFERWVHLQLNFQFQFSFYSISDFFIFKFQPFPFYFWRLSTPAAGISAWGLFSYQSKLWFTVTIIFIMIIMIIIFIIFVIIIMRITIIIMIMITRANEELEWVAVWGWFSRGQAWHHDHHNHNKDHHNHHGPHNQHENYHNDHQSKLGVTVSRSFAMILSRSSLASRSS